MLIVEKVLVNFFFNGRVGFGSESRYGGKNPALTGSGTRLTKEGTHIKARYRLSYITGFCSMKIQQKQ